MFKYRLIRAMLKVATFYLPVFESGKAPIAVPERFLVFSQIPEDFALRTGLIRAYQTVFSDPPWGEEWPEDAVLTKLNRELKEEDSFLVIMQGNERWPVAGFSWGALLPVDALELRIRKALGTRPIGLEAVLRARGVNQVVYFDEFAILREFRGGLDAIRFLLRPGLDLGYQHGVRQTLFWSSPASKIVPLSLYMGYQSIFSIEVERKKVVFLYNDNFIPILKIGQNMEWRRVVRIMRATSSILGQHKAGT